VKTPTKDRRSNKPILYVGLDVHKETTAVALAEASGQREVRSYGVISSDLHAIEKLTQKLRRQGFELRVVYEAGPCGFGIARRLRQLGVDCQVIAPSLTPKRAGDKRKNNRRDALMLARLHRAGELTCVHVPDPDDEALRDLCRARTDAMNDLRRSRQQLKAQLLRLGYKYTGKTSWNEAHERYLREVVLPHAAHKIALEEYIQSIGAAKERVDRITAHIETLARDWRLWPCVEAIMCLRGFQVLSAVITLSELGDLSRFEHPGKLMGYLGLLPSEHLSGDDETRKQGGPITKTGNGHVRWILIEAAQHYVHPPKVSKELSKRQQGKPRRLLEISWQAQNRLYRRYRALLARGKIKPKAITAVARELAAFLWAIYSEWHCPGSVPPRPISGLKTQSEKPSRRPTAKCTRSYTLHPIGSASRAEPVPA
jgi:transposase